MDDFQSQLMSGQIYISNIKYINVSLRSFNANTKMHEVYNLGLEEITRKATSENIQYYVQRKLSKFLLDFDQDIVASTHDGAAVMKKYGQNISAYSQLCLNHALHLCVVECFYTDRKSHVEVSDEESENSDYESDFDCEDLYKSEGSSIESERNSETVERKKNIYIEEILRKVRKCVNTFAKSNEKQKKLQEYIQKEQGKEVRLSLDVKHRWNSMAKMVAQFLKVYKCVNHALLDMGLNTFSEAEINSLEELHNLLEPLELAVIEFSKDSATLIEAEGIFKFLVNKLKKINSQPATHLYKCLKSRFDERRSPEMTSLIIYLSSGNFPVQSYEFTYCSKKSTKDYGERIYSIPRLIEQAKICDFWFN